MELNKIYCENCLDTMSRMPNNFIDCCVTSPPYFGLRDYGTAIWVGGDKNCDHIIQNDLKEIKNSWERPSRIESNKVCTLLKCQLCGKEFLGKIGNRFCSTKCLNTLSNEERQIAISELANICPKCGAIRHDEQIGLEETPELYVNKLVEVFREVKRVLKKDGTLWLNLGDTYYNYRGKNDFSIKQTISKNEAHKMNSPSGKRNSILPNLKGKDLIGIPWMVAFALRADGWYLRQDIIWHKPNPMPESVTDRCTKSHEYIFLLAKSQKYYYDADAIKEPWINRLHDIKRAKDKTLRYKGKYKEGYDKANSRNNHLSAFATGQPIGNPENGRNKRSVWTINTKPYSEAHFATFPEDLIVPMIKAGCPEVGIVYDPFNGAGTTCLVSHKLNRKWIGSDISPEYCKIAEKRIEPYLMQQKLF